MVPEGGDRLDQDTEQHEVWPHDEISTVTERTSVDVLSAPCEHGVVHEQPVLSAPCEHGVVHEQPVLSAPCEHV